MLKCNFSNFSYFKPTVHNYDPAIDEPKVKGIAIENLASLCSIRDFNEDKNAVFERQVLPIFHMDHAHKKVLRLGNETVGFITYQEDKSFFGNYAKIEHLAVEESYQKKGYGSLLLKNALEHLKDNGVDFVDLETTETNVFKFYTKHNFKILEYPDFRYNRKIGKLVLNFHEGHSSFAFRCLNKIRRSRTNFSRYAYLYGMPIAVVLALDHTSKPDHKQQEKP